MGDYLRGGWARGQMIGEGEQSCTSHYLRHAMRADHIVHRRVVFFASKQGFAAGSRFRRYDIHLSIPILPTQRGFTADGGDTRADDFDKNLWPPGFALCPPMLQKWSLR